MTTPAAWSTSPAPMTANEENFTASLSLICPIRLSTIPAAINPMAPKTTALYDAEAVAQNSFSTSPFYGQDESGCSHPYQDGERAPSKACGPGLWRRCDLGGCPVAKRTLGSLPCCPPRPYGGRRPRVTPANFNPRRLLQMLPSDAVAAARQFTQGLPPPVAAEWPDGEVGVAS